MYIYKCKSEDISKLALMNKNLIEDEKSSNTMTLADLEGRMRDFLNSEYIAYYFMEQNSIIGYALIKTSCQPLYLRQFYIDRDYRRQHYGKQAFEMLMEYLEVNTIDVDVLPWNRAGLSFWKDCGFEETCISMRYEK